MLNRRFIRKFDWTTLSVLTLLFGLYLVTWLVFRPKLPITWHSTPYQRVFHRNAPDTGASAPINPWPGSHVTASPLSGADVAPCLCPPCYFPPFNCSVGTVSKEPSPRPVQPISCVTDTALTVVCLRGDDDQVYLPASFVKDLFEVYGDLKSMNGEHVYHFRFSNAVLYLPQPTYHPGGVFLNFDHIHVEHRSQVMCVTASEGVPLTSQWSSRGYHYAITIAQFGLSHHAKGLLNGNPAPKTLASAEVTVSKWDIPQLQSSIETVVLGIGGLNRSVLSFSSPALLNATGPTLQVQSRNQSLTFDLLLVGPGGVSVAIRTKDGQRGYVHYSHEAPCLRTAGGVHVHYGMDTVTRQPRWTHLARDVGVDWWKGYPDSPFDQIVSLTLHGRGYIDNVTLGPSAHVEHLLQAADWLVTHQDARGGWPTHLAIQTGPIQLKAGWYSAMGQGQAMSALVRAYNVTGMERYLAAAIKAIHIFSVPATQGGVLAKLWKHLDWYEEYPTTPNGTFVLNGFIFSLLGLYDVMETAQGEDQTTARRLWTNGMTSLKSMLGMFDSGAGTFYDLRHVSQHEQPNRARWDYHAVHVTLLYQLAIIDPDPILTSTLERWKGYFHGQRSKHN